MIEHFSKKEIIINGKKYSSLAELPPEEREKIEKAMAMLSRSTVGGKAVRFILKHVLKGKEGLPQEILKALDAQGKDGTVFFETSGNFEASGKGEIESQAFSRPDTVKLQGEQISWGSEKSGSENLEGSGFKAFLLFIVIGVVVLYYLR